MADPKPKITILLVDRHAMFRTGLRALLNREERFEVIGEAEDPHQAIQAATDLKPRIVLMEVKLRGNPFFAAREIRKISPLTKIIFVTMYDDEDYYMEAAECGASGYVLKTSDFNKLVSAIWAVHFGETDFDAGMMRELVKELQEGVPRLPRRLELYKTLSQVELEALRMWAAHFPDDQISSALGIEPAAMWKLWRGMLQKLEIWRKAQLFDYALDNGLIDLKVTKNVQ